MSSPNYGWDLFAGLVDSAFQDMKRFVAACHYYSGGLVSSRGQAGAEFTGNR